ncbi:hypothetical protein N7495_001156 [Penicillium taxi]|uniref:uncharacterized protein n=1 Tax=Penicillium taxi TaxID=168475 RepID=UPI002545575B|nr:uncharacterized protein N7495_001156 [Penicillium taxi]KAJ5908474.1 hypothetical protein N7495_001156 [Penicillium taxi]
MTYGSKTRLDGNESTQSLKELGMLLRNELKIVTRRRVSTVDTLPTHAILPSFSVPSIFIAHSLGGLTVKEALLQESDNPEPGTIIHNLYGALFFGVPSHGMETTALEAMIRGQPNESLVRSISPESETLTDLSQKFKLRFASGKPKIVYFYELEESCCPKFENGEWKMTGTPKKILVNKDSATDGGRWIANVRMEPLNRNHSDLVKFSNPDDSDLSRVLNELTKLVGEAECLSSA